MTEVVAKDFGVKYEHLFSPKVADPCTGLKIFVEEHLDVVFDFVVVGHNEKAWQLGSSR